MAKGLRGTCPQCYLPTSLREVLRAGAQRCRRAGHRRHDEIKLPVTSRKCRRRQVAAPDERVRQAGMQDA